MILKNHAGRWKFGWGAAVVILGLGTAGQRRGGSADLTRPEVGPEVGLEVGGGGIGLVGEEGVRPPEARLREPRTDGTPFVQISDQQSEAEEGDNSLAQLLTLIEEKIYHDEKTEEDVLQEDRATEVESIAAVTVGDHLRGSHSNKDADSTSLLVEDSRTFTLDKGMDKLKAVSRRLRGVRSDKDVDSASLLVDVKEIAQAIFRSLLLVQEHFERGDEEGAAATLRSVVGDVEYFAKASRGEAKSNNNGLDSLVSSSLDDATPYELDKVSNAGLAEFLRPQFFEEQIEMVADVVDILENFDLSLLSSQVDEGTAQSFESDLDLTNVEHDAQDSMFESNDFDFGFAGGQKKFGQSRGQYRPQNFFDHSTLPIFLNQHNTKAVNLYAQRLNKKSLLFQYAEGVMARHELRMNALGDACPSECDNTDAKCNCEKLFECVKEMSTYDLAVLVAGGFIDRAPTSQNYANFTISVENLSLFDADGELGEKLKRIQEKANEVDDTNNSNCVAVLEELYTGCEPSKVSCMNPNTESFQVSIPQVCSAVKTKTKLLFETIGDEFDGNVDKASLQKAIPLSFDACGEFVAAFDSLYERRNQHVYPLQNPMRKGNTALHDKTTTQIFQHTQFPVRNWFNKNAQTGIVNRTFTGVTGEHYFTIVLKASGKITIATTQTTKAISYDASCGEKVSMKTHDPGDPLQRFKLSDDGRSLVPKNCLDHRLTLVDYSDWVLDNCNKAQVLRLKPASSGHQHFTVKFGYIFNDKCPNLAMSAIEDGTLLGKDQLFPHLKDLGSNVIVSFVHQASQKVISYQCGQWDLHLRQYGDTSASSNAGALQQGFNLMWFYNVIFIGLFGTGSGESSVELCTLDEGTMEMITGEGYTSENCALGNQLKVVSTNIADISRMWFIRPEGFIELVSQSGLCSSVIGVQGSTDGTHENLILQNKTRADPNQIFTLVSDEIILRPAARNLTQLWEFHSVDPPYDLAVLPGFPGWIHRDRFLGVDKELSKYAMQICDQSMDLLLGSQMSLGTLRAIVSDVQDGPERMPGKCCFDTPTSNQDYLGLEFDPAVMNCINPGLWHLGISKEACNNAGGKWFRSPCVTLKRCIDARPARFNLTSPQDGTCQDASGRVNIGFVQSDRQHPKYAFDGTASGCSNFCRSLPDDSHQVGMMTVNDGDNCICMYNDGKVPDQVPEYAVRSPPKFSLISNGKALGLSHEITDCTVDEINIEVQDYVGGSPRQQLHLSSEGQLVSAKCPQRVFTALENGNLKAMAPYYHLSDVEMRQQQWVYNASSESISNVMYPDSLISSINSGVSTLNSYYFSIANQRTGLMLAVDGDTCADGLRLVLQTETAGSLNQKFKLGDVDKIISMKCPSYAITIPLCVTDIALQLQALGTASAPKNRWQFGHDGKIESLDCPSMFIGTGLSSRDRNDAVTPAQRGAGSGNTAYTPRVRAGTRSAAAARGGGRRGPPDFENSAATDKTAYNETAYNERPVLGVGAEIVLLSSEMKNQFLTWTQRHRSFTDLIGPYFFVNSGTEFAMGIEDGECTNEMSLNAQEHDPNSANQLFYIGNYGSIYSAKCRGGAISMLGSCGEENLIKLRSFEDDNSMKWEYKSNGVLRSAKCPKSPENVECNSLLTRKVRIDWLGTDCVISLREVQVFDFDGDNRALKKNVQMYPESNLGYESMKSVDGVDSTYTLTNETLENVYWEIDLGVDVLVKEVVVTPFDHAHLYNSKVTLLDENGGIVEAYHLNDLPETTALEKIEPQAIHLHEPPETIFTLEKVEQQAIALQDTSKRSVAGLVSNSRLEASFHGETEPSNRRVLSSTKRNKPGGEPCFFSTGCVSRNCVYLIPNNPDTYVCSNQNKATVLPIGSSCTQDSQCEGRESFCLGGNRYRVGTCTPPRSGGYSCGINRHCVSGNCVHLTQVNRVCSNQSSVDVFPIGSPCTDDSHCEGNAWCNGYPSEIGACASASSLGPIGSPCRQDSHCEGNAECYDGTTCQLVISIIDDSSSMALVITDCDANLVQLQNVARENARQFFLENDGRISSVKCPGKSLALSASSCDEEQAIIPLTSSDDDHFKWIFHDDGSIESAHCQGKYWGGDWGAFEIVSIINDENKAITAVDCEDDVVLPLQEYNEDDVDQHFFLRFDSRISPVKCSDKELAIGGTTCHGDVMLASSGASHFKWTFNQQDGSIESSNCRGSYWKTGKAQKVIMGGFDSMGARGWTVKPIQRSYNLLSRNMKMTWSVYHQPPEKFNLSCQDFVASVDEDASTSPSEIRLTLAGVNQHESKKWNRENTRLLSAQSGGSLWNQKWKLSFVEDDYDSNGIVGDLLGPKIALVPTQLVTSGPIGADATGSLSDPDAMLAGGEVTITSQSGDMSSTPASFFFASVHVSGRAFSLEVYSEDGLVAQGAEPWAKFGLMVRDDLTSASKYFAALWTTSKNVRVQYGESESALSGLVSPGVSGGGWMKIERNGDDFSAFFKSKTDSTYTSIGNKAIVMGRSVHIGVALSSHDGPQISVTFSSFSTQVLYKCYGLNQAFSPAFEEFGKGSAIANAADEAQCQHARAQLAFDADYPFDADVCNAFNKKMCGLEFLTNYAEVDYALESLSSPPEFDQVEYEAAEYDRVEYTEDVFAAPKYDDDPELVLEPINAEQKDWIDAVDEESSGGSSPSKDALQKLQDTWLGSQLAEHSFDRAYMMLTDKEFCEVIPETFPLGWVAVPNPAYLACKLAKLLGQAIVATMLITAQIMSESFFIAYEKQTEGPDGEVYSNNASRKTYWNLKNLDKYLKDALQKTNDNMHRQHESMRKHLQTRHLQLETNIRKDIFDSENDLGRAIVAAQNALGEIIVDSRNANGQAIVDARNANSDQHNALSAWLHENLCRIYEANGGTCSGFIGPLPEDQSFTPMVLGWPEGEPNMMDRLEHLEVISTGIHEAVAKGEVMHGVETANAESVEDKVDAMEAKLDAMQGEMDEIKGAMQGEMDEIKGVINVVENKMDDMGNVMQGEMDEIKGVINAVKNQIDDMGNKMDDMTELISRVMQQNMKAMEALA